MCVELEPQDNMNDFERELQSAFARRPAPPHLKRKIMERRRQQAGRSHRTIWLERLAASLILAAVASGAALWHHEVEQRRGEEARQQVMTALRIANHALDQMNAQLAEHNRDAQ
jgi:hypothetical protein